MDEIMLSALQHYAFCPRQCALIHLEQVWSENGHTAEGRLMHEHVHGGSAKTSEGMKAVGNVELKCNRLGLHGFADVVEYHYVDGSPRPYPVEYKKGSRSKKTDADEIQLCGQALCLEEMHGIRIEEGALFYGKNMRRKIIFFTEDLRRRTEEIALAVHRMFENGCTPPAEAKPTCETCSLFEYCMPNRSADSAARYLKKLCEDTDEAPS